MRNVRILSVVGARPQFVKLAPVHRALKDEENARAIVEHVILHTGQHYDGNMSDVFFEELQIPRPDINLAVGSASHGVQTARMLEGIESSIRSSAADAVIVFGDTNSTLAGALAAAKLGVLVAHVEAGLRSNNRRMPEELNRVATDHLSDLLLAPTAAAVSNLQREGLEARTYYTGDVMFDALLSYKGCAEHSTIRSRLGLQKGGYAVATLHRAENTELARLVQVLSEFNRVADLCCPLVFPVHPRTRALLANDLPEWRPSERLRLIEPLPYLEMLALVVGAACVITDSGGLQKEAAMLNCPCLTIRDETEWVETIAIGANRLVGSDAALLLSSLQDVLQFKGEPVAARAETVAALYGDGNASRIVADRVIDLALQRTTVSS